MNMLQRKDEEGQTMILLGIVMSVLMLLTVFVVDGGFGLVQMRRAQNAADFASVAASKLMPCSVGANASVTAAQIQSTVQNIVNDNTSGTTSWTGQYLTSSGSAISGATFSNTTAASPPSNACGVSIKVTGTWNSFFGTSSGFKTISAQSGAGAVGNGSQSYSLAIASLLPYARHTIYAGAVGNFVVNGSMYDNSVAQCSNRNSSCKNYSQCSSGTPVSNIVCYGDSADVFQQSSEDITGTLYSVAPVAIDPCFYQAPSSGTAVPMSSYSQYYSTYGCGSQFSSSSSPLSYGGMQGNITAITDPLANLPDPSSTSNAGAICPGQSSASSYSSNIVSSGNLQPGVYTNTVVITGSVTLLPCQTGGTTTAPGIYIFQKGLEICPSSTSTVTGSDVMLYSEAAPSSTYSNLSTTSNKYCAATSGSSSNVQDGIDIGGPSGAKVNLTAPTSGPYDGVAIYQDRNINLNVGLDDGWTDKFSTYRGTTYITGGTIDAATINITGVVYDNSFTTESSGEVFTYIGQSYGGPYSSLCTGTTSTSLENDPTPCPGIENGAYGITNTAGTVTINGAVIVGGFGTQGGTTSSPLKLTISFNSQDVPSSVNGVKLVF